MEENKEVIQPSTPEEKPTPPIFPEKPNTPDQDLVKRTFNDNYLSSIITNNKYGYNPSSYEKFIKSEQLKSNSEFLNNVFIDKKISNWDSIRNLKVMANDEQATLELRFNYGVNSYKKILTRNEGLLSNEDYWRKLDNITFGFYFKSSGIVSDREMPVADHNGNMIKNFDNGQDQIATFKNNCVMMTSGRREYIREFSSNGTAWLVDYLPSSTNADFQEFIIATNLHVGNLSEVFHHYSQADWGKKDPKEYLSIDPLYIKTYWGKRSMDIDYNIK